MFNERVFGRCRRIVGLVLILLACFWVEGVAQEGQEDTKAEKTLSPYFFVKGDPRVDQLPLKSTDVRASIAGVIADVAVKQVYANEGTRAINATYVFPASTRAAVYSMRMRIGDQIIYAKIKEREQAKQDFEKGETRRQVGLTARGASAQRVFHEPGQHHAGR